MSESDDTAVPYWKNPRAELVDPMPDNLEECGHDPSGGECDYDCPRFVRSHAGF